MTEQTRLSPEDLRALIREHLPLVAVPALPHIRLHRAHPASGLRRLAERDPEGLGSPYWAYPWPGGVGLAAHVTAQPKTVAEKRVLDLGTGCGVVAIAAAKAGARNVIAADIDRHALAALALNAEANDVVLTIVSDDLTALPPPEVDVVLVGDLFYARSLARRVTRFLENCRTAGIAVLVGDIGRAYLPRRRLARLGEYPVTEFGRSDAAAPAACTIYAFDP